MARNLETRIERLEAVSLIEEEDFPEFIVAFEPWCSVGRHPLPHGYLRGYQGCAERKPGESEEELTARARAIAEEQRGPRCGILLVEDRECMKCVACPSAESASLN